MKDLVQTIGPVEVRRLSEGKIILGVCRDRADGSAAVLDVKQCDQIALALHTVIREDKEETQIPAFAQELRRRCEVVSGLKFDPDHHSGMIQWLAEKCSVTPMTASRYLKGQAQPVNYVAQRISRVLGWPWDDLVASIVEERVGSTIRHIYRKYHARRRNDYE